MGASSLIITNVPYPDFPFLSLEHGGGWHLVKRFVSDSSRNQVAQPHHFLTSLYVLFRSQAATPDLRCPGSILYWTSPYLFRILLEYATDPSRQQTRSKCVRHIIFSFPQ